MGASYTSCAGIGIEFNEENVNKFDPDLWERFSESDDKYEFLDELVVDMDDVKVGTGGNGYSGETTYYMFVCDPIFGVVDYLSEMKMIGFTNIDKMDLDFISEIRIC